MSNPYQAPEITVDQPSAGPVRKIAVRPMARLGEAKQFLGDKYWTFVGICLVGILVGSALAIVLMGPMMCGIFFCFFQREKGHVTFDMVFKGFDYFLESFVAMLIMTLVIVAIEIPFFIVFGVLMGVTAAASGGEEPPPFMLAFIPVFYIALFALILTIQVPFAFVFPLIVERKMKPMDAIKMSWQGAKINFMGILGMYALHMLLGLACACACYFPVFLLMPLAVGSTFLIYREIYPTDQKLAPA